MRPCPEITWSSSLSSGLNLKAISLFNSCLLKFRIFRVAHLIIFFLQKAGVGGGGWFWNCSSSFHLSWRSRLWFYTCSCLYNFKLKFLFFELAIKLKTIPSLWAILPAMTVMVQELILYSIGVEQCNKCEIWWKLLSVCVCVCVCVCAPVCVSLCLCGHALMVRIHSLAWNLHVHIIYWVVSFDICLKCYISFSLFVNVICWWFYTNFYFLLIRAGLKDFCFRPVKLNIFH